LDLQLLVQSVPITTKVVSSNPVHGEVRSIQHYVVSTTITPPMQSYQIMVWFMVLNAAYNNISAISWREQVNFQWDDLYIMKRKFKQWWSPIPPISTKGTTTSRLNWAHWTQDIYLDFPTSICVQWAQFRREVVVPFVDIGGIGDHHCLNFLFII
jgi:hypothetical protein